MSSLKKKKERERWYPKPYQERALNFMMTQASVGLILDPGLGKTSTVLAAYSILKSAGVVKNMLVIAPVRVCYQVWPNEVNKWHDFSHLKAVVLHGKDKEKLLRTPADIYIINPEGLPWLFAEGRLDLIDVDVLAVDESTKFKNTASQRFKLLKPLIPRFNRRWILTGTFSPNGITDVFGQVYILDKGGALGKNITQFRRRWFYQSGFGGYDWSPMPGAYDEITSRVQPLCIRIEAKDNLEMPELRVGGQWDIHVPLDDKSMKIYKEVESVFISAMSTGNVVAVNAAVVGTKCRQIANGAVFTDNGGWEEVHRHKLDALESIVEELGGSPLLVFYEYEHDKVRIQEKFNCPSISGAAPEAADRLIAQFNQGKIPVLLAHPASAGHGLNMQDSCAHVCWFSMTWNLEHYIQGIDRVYRQGQKQAVTVYRILAGGTIDETIAEVLEMKDANQNKLHSALKEALQ